MAKQPKPPKERGTGAKIAIGGFKLIGKALSAGGGDEKERCGARLTSRQSCGKKATGKKHHHGTCGSPKCIAALANDWD